MFSTILIVESFSSCILLLLEISNLVDFSLTVGILLSHEMHGVWPPWLPLETPRALAEQTELILPRRAAPPPPGGNHGKPVFMDLCRDWAFESLPLTLTVIQLRSGMFS